MDAFPTRNSNSWQQLVGRKPDPSLGEAYLPYAINCNGNLCDLLNRQSSLSKLIIQQVVGSFGRVVVMSCQYSEVGTRPAYLRPEIRYKYNSMLCCPTAANFILTSELHFVVRQFITKIFQVLSSLWVFHIAILLIRAITPHVSRL